MDTHLKRISEALLMSTHSICFYGEIGTVQCGCPLSETLLISITICFYGERTVRCGYRHLCGSMYRFVQLNARTTVAYSFSEINWLYCQNMLCPYSDSRSCDRQHSIFFLYFSEKMRLDISCESLTDDSHEILYLL